MLQIEVKSLRVGDRLLAEDMLINISAGSMHLLQGPNGCGKSLLLDVVTGIYRTSGVTVWLNGERLKNGNIYARWQKGIRRMFQSPEMPSELQVSRILEQYGFAGSSDKWWLDASKLLLDNEVRLEDTFGEHSFGQQRLVELTIALSSGNCILLDEPFAGLKPSLLKAVSSLVKLSAKLGRAILTVDHLSSRHPSLYDMAYEWKLPRTPREPQLREELRDIFNKHQSTFLAEDFVGAKWLINNFSINKRRILHDAEIVLPPRTALFLIGGNGTGKSTLLRALGGYTQPWFGVSSNIVRDFREEELLLSPQPPKLVDELTTEENLWLMIGRGRRVGAATRNAAKDLLDWIGFSSINLSKRAEILSGGESGMVALIGAVLSKSMILFLDEPFESLSQEALSRAMNLLESIVYQGKSVVVSTHSAQVIASVDRSQSIDLTKESSLSGFWIGKQMSSPHHL